MDDPRGPKTKAVRARVAHHLQQMVTLAATTTLTTTACACDMIPPPARVPLDAATLGPSATLLQEANTIYLDITVPNNGYCTFDPTFGDVEGSLVVNVAGGSGMTIRVRPTANATHVAGNIVCARTDGTQVRSKVRLEADLPTAQNLPTTVAVQSKTISEDPKP